MVRHHQRRRRGAALAIVLFALVTLGAVAHALVQPAVAGRRASRRIAAHHGAESASERAIANTLGLRPPAFWRTLGIGEVSEEVTTELLSASSVVSATVTVRVARLSESVFSVVVRATVPAPDASVTVRRSVLVELRRDPVRDVPALTSGGNVRLDGDSRVEGGSGCEAAGDSVPPALLVSPDALVQRAGSTFDEGVKRDALADAPETYAHPGGVNLERLTASAAATLPEGSTVSPAPVTDATGCVAGASNWGDLAEGDGAGACAAYAPVIVATGDLRIEGGEGQGALIVNGRLTIAGSFRYSGLIVASGGISTDGAVTITGALFTAPDGSVTFGTGPAVILGSRCALEPASQASARLWIVPVRGWWR